MDVSPKTLREVEFREKMRGYHPEDVDQFLERVAAGIEVLQDRLRQTMDRVQRAEQAANEAGGSDETLRRTLVLAQRTADLAVQEAREQAARILASAEQQAQSIIGEAEERARRSHEDALVEVKGELNKLEASRQQLQADVENLTRWVDEHRAHLKANLSEAMAKVDQAVLLSPAPTSRPLDLSATRSGGIPPPPAPPGPDSADRAQPAANSAPELPSTMAWQPGPGDLEEPDEGATGTADPYFAQLRRAVNEPDPLGPRPSDDDLPEVPPVSPSMPRPMIHDQDAGLPDPAADDFFDQDLAEAKRFGGRWRRRG
jgi:cell division initiation protein